jgi:hypothetical protein
MRLHDLLAKTGVYRFMELAFNANGLFKFFEHTFISGDPFPAFLD